MMERQELSYFIFFVEEKKKIGFPLTKSSISYFMAPSLFFMIFLDARIYTVQGKPGEDFVSL